MSIAAVSTTGNGTTGTSHITGSRAPRLRMTERGRTFLTVLVAGPLVLGAVAFALNGGQATASLEGSGVDFQYVTVNSGDTLWQVAGDLAPQADPREVIDQIVQLNQLTSSDVFAGQQLAIPAEYASN